MTDRELLELAAKAAGIEIIPHPNKTFGASLVWLAGGKNWNPLIEDGDALRLAVRLKMELSYFVDCCSAGGDKDTNSRIEKIGDDPYTATRRAIVRAAAEIGKEPAA